MAMSGEKVVGCMRGRGFVDRVRVAEVGRFLTRGAQVVVVVVEVCV